MEINFPIILPTFDPVIFSIWQFQIRWYSLAYIFGIVFGWLMLKKFNKEKIAATIKGARVPKSANSPPIPGPKTNPIPKAAPIIPKFFALFSGVEISAIYAAAEV